MVSQILVNKVKPFTLGQLVNVCMTDVSKLFPEKKRRKTDETNLAGFVFCRTDNITRSNEEYSINTVHTYLSYSLTCDESTHSTDTAQLTISI
jgi:hypothetical protein